MDRTFLHHEPKSQYAYALDENRLMLMLRTKKSQCASVSLLFGDPFYWGPGEAESKWVWRGLNDTNYHLSLDYQDRDYDYWRIVISPNWKRVRYAFLIDGTWLFTARGVYNLTETPEKTADLSDYFNFPYINTEDIFKGPSWVKDTVWYQIFPERFCNGDPSLNESGTLDWDSKPTVQNHMRFGGDLPGIIDKLDYLSELGITGIYFTPIFKATSTHKYDTIDYFAIDPCFGTNADFKQLVDKAHRLGIKVMLDGVFNHCGFFHPFFQDVIEKGRGSKYFDWFHILREPVLNFPLKDGYPKLHSHELAGQLNYETFAFTPMMPKWRTGNPECEAYLLSVGKYWVEAFGIDGWRLDVSNEVSHHFWRKFRTEIKNLDPNCFLLGENWDDAMPWLRGDQFDGVMNYEWTTPIWRLLGNEKAVGGRLDPEGFILSMSRVMALIPEPIFENMFNLLDSHDTSRLATLFESNLHKQRLAYWMQMTFGGSPSIYYGSEVALEGEGDGNRMCMPWAHPPREGVHYKFLKGAIALRKSEPLLRKVYTQFITACLPLICYEKTDGETILRFIVNPTKENHEVAEAHWPETATVLDADLWTATEKNGNDPKNRMLSRNLKPYTGVMLKLRKG